MELLCIRTSTKDYTLGEVYKTKDEYGPFDSGSYCISLLDNDNDEGSFYTLEKVREDLWEARAEAGVPETDLLALFVEAK